MIIRRKNHLTRGMFRDFFRHYRANKVISGNDIASFEQAILAQTNVPYGVATSCGSHALMLILEYYRAAGLLKDRSEVLIPAFTSYIIVELLDFMGIRYRTIDITEERAVMDPEDLETKISGDSKIVLATHLMGNMCDLRIAEICKKHNLILIEDCAHAHGARWSNGSPAGALGEASFYSFGYSKIINTCSGGILLTQDRTLHEFARVKLAATPLPSVRNVFFKLLVAHFENWMTASPLSWLLVPFLKKDELLKSIKRRYNVFAHDRFQNLKTYSNLQAHWGLRQLKSLPKTNETRMANEKKIILAAGSEVSFLSRQNGDVSYLVIARVKDAKKCRDHLFRQGIDTGIGTTIMEATGPIAEHPLLANVLKRYVQLPAHGDLPDKQLHRLGQLLATQNTSIT